MNLQLLIKLRKLSQNFIQARAINSITDDDVRVSKDYTFGKVKGFEPGKIGPVDAEIILAETILQF